MRAVDTDVLLRLTLRDDESQYASAVEFVKPGAWVSILALAQTVWELGKVYQFGPNELAAAVEMLLVSENLTVQDSETVKAALDLFRSRPALGFMDCLLFHLARDAGHQPFGTFDRALSRVVGAQRL
jgi:predicted nucleic-acid-binding protein